MRRHAESERLSPGEVERLTAAATAAARSRTYSVYSRFPVGAAVRVEGGLFAAGNIENASYGLTICAERIALGKAVSAGRRSLIAIAVACIAADDTAELETLLPCGACRQWMAEFAEPELEIFICGPTAAQSPLLSLAELLPRAFRLPRASPPP